MISRIAVVRYSATGNVYATAKALAEGAAEAGAEVRLHESCRLVVPLATDEVERVLRGRGGAVVVLGGHEHETARTPRCPRRTVGDEAGFNPYLK
jgi:hypothetical protein